MPSLSIHPIRGTTGSVFAVLLVLAGQASAQKPYAFIVDASKPYVYLAFDHAGRREPAREGESPQGLWLRLINNCRVRSKC